MAEYKSSTADRPQLMSYRPARPVALHKCSAADRPYRRRGLADVLQARASYGLVQA